jgi:hypothetical protein
MPVSPDPPPTKALAVMVPLELIFPEAVIWVFDISELPLIKPAPIILVLVSLLEFIVAVPVLIVILVVLPVIVES